MEKQNKQTKKSFNYQTAFYLLLILFFISLTFYLVIQYFSVKSASEIAFYNEITAQTTYDSRTENNDLKVVNINTASLYELMTLPGIGETKAKAIINYRSTYGIMTETDDLLKIDGIGENTVQDIAPYICFFDDDADTTQNKP